MYDGRKVMQFKEEDSVIETGIGKGKKLKLWALVHSNP
jgi:hypothetical protein